MLLSPLLASLPVALLAALTDGASAPGPADANVAVASAASGDGDDFITDARLLYRIAACPPTTTPTTTTPTTTTPAKPAARTTTPPPDALSGALPEIAEQHCRQMRLLIDRWRHRWLDKAVPFLAGLVPAGLPAEVVYPFGGGDLFTALATFPHASTITTLSLEPSGNPQTFAAAPADVQEHALSVFRDHVRRLSFTSHSKTTNLLEFRHEALPDQLAFALLALVAFDLEPVRLRFFDVGADGTLHYLTRDAIAARKKRQFANMELDFRRRGDAGAPVRIHRHLQTNLADQPLGRTPGVLAHLAAKGHVAAMAKAASYLLWSPSFTRIRGYLLEYADWMISDSTGIPPRFAGAAGFEQQTWGQFTGAFLAAAAEHEQAFVSLWAEQPARPLAFGFGYQDKDGHDHLLVTRRKAAPP